MIKKVINKNEIHLLTDIATTFANNDNESLILKSHLVSEIEEIGDNRDIYVKLIKDIPIAMIQLIYKNADNNPELANGKDIAHIHGLGVRIDQQGKGAGQEMIKFLEDEARNSGIKVLTLGVDSTNPRAIQLYTFMGYSTFKEEEGRVPEEKLYLLKKELI